MAVLVEDALLLLKLRPRSLPMMVALCLLLGLRLMGFALDRERLRWLCELRRGLRVVGDAGPMGRDKGRCSLETLLLEQPGLVVFLMMWRLGVRYLRELRLLHKGDAFGVGVIVVDESCRAERPEF